MTDRSFHLNNEEMNKTNVIYEGINLVVRMLPSHAADLGFIPGPGSACVDLCGTFQSDAFFQMRRKTEV